VMLCIGGIDMRSQMDMLKRGVHIVVATPGRLKDLLSKRRMNLDICRCGGECMVVRGDAVLACGAGTAGRGSVGVCLVSRDCGSSMSQVWEQFGVLASCTFVCTSSSVEHHTS
jgi:hypothetical protein